MKIFIPTSAHPPRCVFLRRLLDGDVRFTLVVHSREDVHRMKTAFGSDLEFAVHGCPNEEPIERVAWIRQWIEDELLEEGEWYGMADDKVLDLERLRQGFWDVDDLKEVYERWGSDAWRDLVKPRELYQLFADIRDKCEELGTIYGGVTDVTNPFFRLSAGRWWTRRSVPATVCVSRKDVDIPWLAFGRDKPWIHYEDAVRTVFVVDKYGSVAVDKFHSLRLQKKTTGYYEKGIGTLEYRLPYINKTIALLRARFPDVQYRPPMMPKFP